MRRDLQLGSGVILISFFTLARRQKVDAKYGSLRAPAAECSMEQGGHKNPRLGRLTTSFDPLGQRLS
jgi:hypothetical protein